MDDLRPESLKRPLVVFLFFLHPALSWVDDKAAISVLCARELLDQFVTVEGKGVATQQEGRNTNLSLSSAAKP